MRLEKRHIATRFALLFVVAFLVRLAAALFLPLEPTGDAVQYDAIGLAISKGQGFTDEFRPPLYPAFIGAIYYLAGHRAEYVRIAQLILDLGTCVLLWYWAKRRLGDETAALTLLVAGFSLSAIGAVRILMSECLASFLLTAAIVLFDLGRSKRDRWKWLAGVGIFCGLLTLTRGLMILFPFMLILYLLFEHGSVREKYRLIGVLTLCYVLALTPWLIRNWMKLGSPILTTQVGVTFYSSHIRNSGQPYGVLTSDEITEHAEMMHPIEGSRFLTKATMRRLIEKPWISLSAYPEKLVSFWVPLDWEIIGGRTWNTTYILVVVFGLFGCIQLVRRKRGFVICALLPLTYLCLMAFPFYGSPRFRLPAEAPLSPIAAAGVMALRRKKSSFLHQERSS